MSNGPALSSFTTLVNRAAARYPGIADRAFARGKLSWDPVYERALDGGLLPFGGTLLDIGCGQGLMLALLTESTTPRFRRMVGVETKARMVRLARAALGEHAEIVQADARTVRLEPCSVVLMFDVLQMMPLPEQDALLRSIVAVLEPGGVVLIREADSSARWRFQLVRTGNRIKSACLGAWNQRRHYRTRDEWLSCLRRLGLEAEVSPTPTRNPLGNVLFRARLPC